MRPRGTHLYSFLRDDIQRKDHHFLLPFLTTNDLLRLSESSKDLTIYRLHLPRVKIAPPGPSPTKDEMTSVTRLLMDQKPIRTDKPSRVDYLALGDFTIFTMLDFTRPCLKALKVLDLGEAVMSADDTTYVVLALTQGGLTSLDEIRLSFSGRDGDGLRLIVEALGGCPHLRRLHLRCVKSFEKKGRIGQDLAGAFESGHVHHLKELDLSCSDFGRAGVAAMAGALQRGACPELIKLNLSSSLYDHDSRGAVALGNALRSCPNLEDLDLSANGPQDEDAWTGPMRALRDGCCVHLKRLNMSGSSVRGQSAIALAQALSSGNCQHIQYLNLGDALFAPENLVVVDAIRQGHLPDLRHLILYQDIFKGQLFEQHGRYLGEAIVNGMCPRLEELRICGNQGLAGGGLVSIVEGLEAGKCPLLKILDVRSIGLQMGGREALLRTLSSGNVCHLEFFLSDEFMGDKSVAQLIRGLKCCPRLQCLNLRGMVMRQQAGQALFQALRDHAWPHLRELDISDNPLGDQVGHGLAEVLMGGCPRLEVLRIHTTGMTVEGAERLMKSLEKGACPSLREIGVGPEVDHAWEEKMDMRKVWLFYT